MRRTLAFFSVFLLASCGASKISDADRPLYEVLIQEAYNGAKFEFYETITEAKEFNMILNDPKLKGRIKADDINRANFVLLNMGEKPSGGYSIGVEKVEETDTSVILTVSKTKPAEGAMVTLALTTPYALVRINSKKEIIIK